MKISEMKINHRVYCALDSNVLAVLDRRQDGWCMYIGAVDGKNHKDEWSMVYLTGTKLTEPVAHAIAENSFFPGFLVDVPYAN